MDAQQVPTMNDITDSDEVAGAGAKERDLLEALLEKSQDFIYFKDRESRFLRCSRAVWQRSFTSEADIIGKTDFDLFAEEHAQAAFKDEQEIMRTGCPMLGKIEREITKDGRETWALTSKMPLRNKNGEIVGTFGINKDITERQQTEAALAQERHLLESLFENSQDCIYFKDRDSRFLRCGKSLSQRLGNGSADIVGKTDFDLYADEHAQAAFKDEQEIMRTGRPLINKVEREVSKDRSRELGADLENAVAQPGRGDRRHLPGLPRTSPLSNKPRPSWNAPIGNWPRPRAWRAWRKWRRASCTMSATC